MGGEEFELRIVALRGRVPPIIRLRHVLKGLLRGYDFRCTSCRDVTPKLPPLPVATPPLAQGERSGISTADRPPDASGSPGAADGAADGTGKMTCQT
jgi:hypothetical protein